MHLSLIAALATCASLVAADRFWINHPYTGITWTAGEQATVEWTAGEGFADRQLKSIDRVEIMVHSYDFAGNAALKTFPAAATVQAKRAPAALVAPVRATVTQPRSRIGGWLFGRQKVEVPVTAKLATAATQPTTFSQQAAQPVSANLATETVASDLGATNDITKYTVEGGAYRLLVTVPSWVQPNTQYWLRITSHDEGYEAADISQSSRFTVTSGAPTLPAALPAAPAATVEEVPAPVVVQETPVAAPVEAPVAVPVETQTTVYSGEAAPAPVHVEEVATPVALPAPVEVTQETTVDGPPEARVTHTVQIPPAEETTVDGVAINGTHNATAFKALFDRRDGAGVRGDARTVSAVSALALFSGATLAALFI